jgi:sulfate transport system ATP-binding protein
VYQFLGDVNLFHGRVAGGGFLHNPSLPEASDGVTAFVRPHDLEVDRYAPSESAIPAVLLHAYALGPKVRLELRRKDNHELMEAELTRDRHRNLGLAAGDNVWVTPKSLRLFRDGEEVAI